MILSGFPEHLTKKNAFGCHTLKCVAGEFFGKKASSNSCQTDDLEFSKTIVTWRPTISKQWEFIYSEKGSDKYLDN